jgi:hypothetical protein
LDLPHDILALLARIQAEQRAVGERVEQPADEAGIDRAAAALRANPAIAFPDPWRAFLRVSDGLDFNGFVLYATAERRYGRLVMLGLAEQNCAMARTERDAPLLLLGETGDDYFAWRPTEGYVIVSRITLETHERFESAAGLLRRVLELALAV